MKRESVLKAQVMDIKRFAVHDGKGIRTTIFFKGCPLRCVWCHNPEGLLAERQLSYIESKCLSCGSCAGICSVNGFREGKHIFNRRECTLCGKCEEVCPAECFRIYGKEYDADELFEIILEDKAFYENTGGGVTLSGGECLLQADFCAGLLKACKENGIHTAVDTCGFVGREAFEKVVPFTDVFLYDMKAIDEEVHLKCTGQSNRIILDNLMWLSGLGKEIEIRIPLVPGYNSDQLEKMAVFLSKMKNIPKVRLLEYHNLSESKYLSLGMTSHMPQCGPVDPEMLRRVKEKFRSCHIIIV